MSTPVQRKRPRQAFESSDIISDNNETSPYSPETKKQRLQDNQNAKIDIADCKVKFTANQPLKTVSGVFKWEATLDHHYYEQDKQTTLAKASFSFFYRDELLKSDELSCLYDIVENNDEFVSSILYLESVQVTNVFRGFDYELCLIERIIDNHARTADMVVIQHNDSVKHICEKMKFVPMEQTGYYSQHRACVQPTMQQFCKCFDEQAAKQRISDTILSNHYVRDDDEKARNETKDNTDEVDVNGCVVTFSSEQNATNNELEDDFISFWSAKLEYQSIVLATARFWFIELNRLDEMGWYDCIDTVLDAPCQELCDLLAVVNRSGGFDERFKLHDLDRINNFRVRSQKTISEFDLGNIDKSKFAAQLIQFDEMNEGGGGNIVYLDRIEVHKEHKGHGYGRGLTQRIIDNFARGFDGVVLKPFPLQWERGSRTDVTEFTEEEKASFEKDKKKVIGVWESMWFYQFGGPNSEYWGRSAAWKHPKMEEFCKCFQATTTE